MTQPHNTMDAPTQPCGSQQQTEEMAATSAPIQSETFGEESECNPSVGVKRKAESSAESEQKQNSLSNQPPTNRQHVENRAAAIQPIQNDAAQSKQTHTQFAQSYVHTYSPHLLFFVFSLN